MSDVLLRGRGPDVGVRASGWLVRLCGVTLAVCAVVIADALGVLTVVGAPRWLAHMSAIVLGALVAPSAFGSVLWILNGLMVGALMLVMYTPLVRPLIAPFVRADAVSPTAAAGAGAADRGPAQAVIVLSGGITDDGRMTGQGLDRLLSAIALAQSRAIGELGLSIVTIRGRVPEPTSEADQRGLVALASAGMQVRFVRNVHSTRDEALQFAALARTHGWRRVVVVTSPLHTRRACAAMEAVGLSVECRPATPRDYSLNGLDRGENRRLAFRDVLYESLGMIKYRLRGWL